MLKTSKPQKKTQLAKLATVNVIEMRDGSLFSIRAFRDNKRGNRQVEAVFAELVRKDDATQTDDDIAEFLDDGNYCPGTGYELFLSHSDTASESIVMPKERLFTITSVTS